ncbi:glutactin-like isoform X2 [Toxorhynchites rutilus septentrionalis]|uniref:glutactin-like isoform X2 n=1 Tax=Toxorhynchites rutilus septentrionalis TaxID=329112 RepID=UPI002479E304|nr:glutactin-like isoform X2 [Toxorhynchites rutilus septentrionalis]
MRPLIGIAFAAFLALCASQHPEPVVKIQDLLFIQGTIGYTAWTNRTIYEFHAIPYAQTPVGSLRFQPPVKITKMNGKLDATKPGIQCPQIWDEYVNTEDEDCLTLSVYTTSLDGNRPVMVWIHGGWFYFGGALGYRSNYLLESDVVLVVIQYRLGPLGFLSFMNDKIRGNMGLLDQIAALEWVQQNIDHFGGNNKEVTIFGESAGGASVSTMLHSPLVQGRKVPLFHRAILQSGSLFSPWAMGDNPVEGAHDIAKRAGCNDPASVEQCLQEVPVKRLLEAFGAHRKETVINHGYPSVAGTTVVVGGPSQVFPEHPKQYLWDVPTTIPIMLGATSQEGIFLLHEIGKFQPEAMKSHFNSYDLLRLVRTLHQKFGQNRLDGVLEAYDIMSRFLVNGMDRYRWEEIVGGLIDICGNHGIKGPVLTELNAFARVIPENVYLYSLDYSNIRTARNLSYPFALKDAVDHAEDLKYLFPRTELNAQDTKVAKIMVQLWTSFATKGIPRAKHVHHWSPAKGLYGPYLKIDAQSAQGENYIDEFSATAHKNKALLSGGKQPVSKL